MSDAISVAVWTSARSTLPTDTIRNSTPALETCTLCHSGKTAGILKATIKRKPMSTNSNSVQLKFRGCNPHMLPFRNVMEINRTLNLNKSCGVLQPHHHTSRGALHFSKQTQIRLLCSSFLSHMNVRHCKSRRVLRINADPECSGCSSVRSCHPATAAHTCFHIANARRIWFRERGLDLRTR